MIEFTAERRNNSVFVQMVECLDLWQNCRRSKVYSKLLVSRYIPSRLMLGISRSMSCFVLLTRKASDHFEGSPNNEFVQMRMPSSHMRLYFGMFGTWKAAPRGKIQVH